MKKDKIIYWITTSLAMLLGAGTAVFYFTEPMIEGFRHIGFPDYFRVQLAICKLIGVPLMLIPAVTKRIKEWVYVAFGIVFISGAIAHGVVDGITTGLMPLVPFALLVVSYQYYRKLYYA